MHWKNIFPHPIKICINYLKSFQIASKDNKRQYENLSKSRMIHGGNFSTLSSINIFPIKSKHRVIFFAPVIIKNWSATTTWKIRQHELIYELFQKLISGSFYRWRFPCADTLLRKLILKRRENKTSQGVFEDAHRGFSTNYHLVGVLLSEPEESPNYRLLSDLTRWVREEIIWWPITSTLVDFSH